VISAAFPITLNGVTTSPSLPVVHGKVSASNSLATLALVGSSLTSSVNAGTTLRWQFSLKDETGNSLLIDTTDSTLTQSNFEVSINLNGVKTILSNSNLQIDTSKSYYYIDYIAKNQGTLVFDVKYQTVSITSQINKVTVNALAANF